MAVKLRMTRIGRRHRPFFRINAVESRTPRDGKVLEKLGHYDPIEKDPQKQIVLNLERVRHWLNNGAIPSDTVSQILLRKGIEHSYAKEKTARRERARAAARAKGVPFNKAERIALEKAAQEDEKKAKAPAEAKPEPQAEAEVKPEAEAKPEVEAKPEAEAKPEVETKVEEKTEAKEEPKEQPKVEAPAEAKPEAETKVKEKAKAKEEPKEQPEAEDKDRAEAEKEPASDEKTDTSDEN